jgi:hypothetical protein
MTCFPISEASLFLSGKYKTVAILNHLNDSGLSASPNRVVSMSYSALTYETSQFVSKATYRIEMRWSKSLGLQIQDRV